MSQKILILYAHPAPRRSEANVVLVDAARKQPGVTFVDLYGQYPTFEIDCDREQQQLLAHDVIIFQHPLYWYSTPAILKEWQDLVLEYGFAYGQEGTALQGKKFFSALTAGGPAGAYRRDGENHFSVRELLYPIEQTARLCGMDYLAPFVLYGARTALDDGRLTVHRREWQRLLQALHDDRFDFEKAAAADIMNSDLDSLILGD